MRDDDADGCALVAGVLVLTRALVCGRADVGDVGSSNSRVCAGVVACDSVDVGW